MLDDSVARRVAQAIIQKTGLGTGNSAKTPEENWTIIVQEVFNAIKTNAVIEVKELVTPLVVDSVVTATVTPAGVVTGTATGTATGSTTAPTVVSLKGKVT
jgi:hypothetical protein